MHLLLVAVVPLQRDLERLLTTAFVASVADEDRFGVQSDLAPVQVLDEALDTAFVAILDILAVALIRQLDDDAAVEEGELAKSLRERVVLELENGEDCSVRNHSNRCTGVVGVADRRDGSCGHSLVIGLAPELAVAGDLELQRLGEGVHDGHTYAMQAA